MKPQASSVARKPAHRRRGEPRRPPAGAGGAATRRRGRAASGAARSALAGAARTVAPTPARRRTRSSGRGARRPAGACSVGDDRAARPRSPSPARSRRASRTTLPLVDSTTTWAMPLRSRSKQERDLRQLSLVVQPAGQAHPRADVRRQLGCKRPFHPSPPSGPIPDVRARGDSRCHRTSPPAGAEASIRIVTPGASPPVDVTANGTPGGAPIGVISVRRPSSVSPHKSPGVRWLEPVAGRGRRRVLAPSAPRGSDLRHVRRAAPSPAR